VYKIDFWNRLLCIETFFVSRKYNTIFFAINSDSDKYTLGKEIGKGSKRENTKISFIPKSYREFYKTAFLYDL